MPQSPIPQTHSPSRVFRRTLIVVISILIAWLGVEIFMRVGFDLLPARVQGDIQAVQRVPWSEERIILEFAFLGDRDFQARLPVGINNLNVRWSDARFTVFTRSIWEDHRAGFRSDAPVYPLDVMTFGDSYAFCWTAFAECWAELLKAYGWNIFNAGNPGTGTSGQWNLMREIVPPTKPKVVVWLWYANDLKDDHDLAVIRGETPKLQTPPEPDPPLAPEGLGKISALAHLIRLATTPRTPSTPYQHYQGVTINERPFFVATNEYPHRDSLAWEANQYGLARNKQAQAEAARFLAEQGIQLVIAFVPTKEETYAPALEGLLGKDYLDAIGEGRRELLDQCHENNWHCIDLLPALQDAARRGESVYYGYDSHLDASGNKVLANVIGTYLQENRLVGKEN